MQPFLYLRAGEVHRLLKERCSMQQLTLQFDGYANETRTVDVKAPVRKSEQVINLVKVWVRAHQEQLECYVGGPVVLVVCFALYYLASVLEGGAL